jgi:predicted ribosomally synthesized peptide with SipW-like signal peptide
MKKKIIISSVVTIVICLCLIAGSTFALFTDNTEINIVVSSANVELEAELGDPILYSAKADANGTLVDENGNKYSHEKQTTAKFSNGGTATYDATNNKLTVNKITPGDKIEFPLSATNSSDVTIQYRFVIVCTDADTAKALTKGTDPMFFTVNGTKLVIDDKQFVSEWETLVPGEDMPVTTITFELPITAGNEYQGLVANFKIIVEAVQGNGVVGGLVDDDDNNVIETGTLEDIETDTVETN